METSEETIGSGAARTQPLVFWMIPPPPDFHKAYRIVSALAITIKAPTEVGGHRTTQLDTTNTSASPATAASPTTAVIMERRTITIMNFSTPVGWTSSSSMW